MTSLQKQLAVIAATSTHQLNLKAQKLAHGKSLLFEPRVAASQSFENIYLVCHDGYRELCALDPRFVQFSRSLFSEQSKVEDRTQMTQKENEKLNGVLETFITMIGPRLLLKPAEKALEWLVRRFRVHEYNTECLVLTYLPYHDTPQFLALLSILPPNPSPALRFLHPYIQSPINPPRRTIVYTAVNTPAFFNALQTHVKNVLQASHQGSTLLSFWSSVTTQAIDGILDQTSSGRKELQDQKTEELLLWVLPVLNACIRISNGSEAVTACYMIIIVLVTKATFEDKVLDSFMEASIFSQDSETLDSCLLCLAVVAEERSQAQLPPAVIKRLLKIPNLSRTLISLSTRCRVDRLVLGCALGALKNIGDSDAKQEFMEELLKSNLLDEPQLLMALSNLLQILEESNRGSSQYSQLVDYVSKLSELPAVAGKLEAVAKKNEMDLESFGLAIGESLNFNDSKMLESEDEDEDEEMPDVEEGRNGNNALFMPPEISESSFLESSSLESFGVALSTLERAIASNKTSRFLGAASLQRQNAFKKPRFLSFLIRTWCSPAPINVRATCLQSATDLIKKNESSTDLQNLVPYLLYALADPSVLVRRSAAACTAALSVGIQAQNSKSSTNIWASSDLYGKNSSSITRLSSDQASGLILSVLVPMLEECTMDANFVVNSVKEVLEGSSFPKASKSAFKSSWRAPTIAFLGTHVALSPLLSVRLRLLPIFTFLGKSSTGVRTHSLLPVLRSWHSLSTANAEGKCRMENIDIVDADRAHLAMLMPKEADSVNIVEDIISGNCSKERIELIDVAFEWIGLKWQSIRSETRLSLAQRLLDISLKESDALFDENCKGRALETLRSVKLDTATLLAFLDSIPPSIQMPEGPPTKKRRRTSRNEMARADTQSPSDISRLLRRLTFVLDLVEGSNPGAHPELIKNLFTILGELQQLKQQSGSDLVYLQSMILGSLTPIVIRLKDEKDTAGYQTHVRADLLVDCIRHSTSPQVQNAALLLIAALASWVPETILHNLMPIFTFIGSTLLRQQDDYSAHVVDQTIARVVPQLAASLRAKHRSFLTGVADLLLSFTAAFEHIPQHRRLKLFSELARTLGPNDSLPAIIALLADRYPNSKMQRRFATDLLLVFDPIMALEAFKGYLDLAEDAVCSKRKESETLFSLNEKSLAQVESALNNLLGSLADFATDERLQNHVIRAFRKKDDPNQPRDIFASIVETIIRISRIIMKQPRLYQCCSRLLRNCLELLPTADLVKSGELLLTNPDQEVQIASIRAVELRAGTVAQHDKRSVSALVAFLPSLDDALQRSAKLDVKRIVLSCMDSIIGRFGKRDIATVTAVAQTVSGTQSLSSNDDQVRILSLLCITSIIDVLEDESISLLPKVLPTAFEYLSAAIENDNTGLHNAVYALLSNTVQRLGFLFSRDYLVPVLKISQQSAASDLEESCDEERIQFYKCVSQYLEAQEIFTSSKSTWTNAIGQGSEAVQEQLSIIRSTIEYQTKSKLVKASSTLFSLLLDVFELRKAITSKDEEDFDDEEVDSLEDTLIEAVIAMILKLNDATFRPFFAQLVELAGSSSITFYKFLAVFFEKFKSIVTSYSSYIVDHAAQLLDSLSQQRDEADLRTAVLTALQKTFEHDQDGFWQSPSHFTAILQPLLFQLTIPSPDQISSTIISTITAFASASSSSTDNHRAINAVLLKYMRAEEAHTRLATVQCERALTSRLGEEWLGLLPEMLPFIAELREDDDEMVERETVRWIKGVEEVLGESLDAMLQ